jgi:hypothetical protein
MQRANDRYLRSWGTAAISSSGTTDNVAAASVAQSVR